MTMWDRVLAAVLAVGCGVAGAQGSGAAAGQNTGKRPMTFADLMAMKRVSDPQISPSGKWVLFSVTDVSLETNSRVNHLWVVPLAGGKERQVTSNTGESFGRFSPNGQFVSYTAAPTKDDPYSRITIAVWDEATGTIGAGRTLRAVSGDADGAIWSPDNKRFLFTTQVYPECSDKPTWAEEDACDKARDDAAANDPVKAQLWTGLLYRHWNAFTGLKRTHVVVADFSMEGPNPRDLTPKSAVDDAETPTFSLGGPLGYAWAPDSKEIAYVTNLDPVPAASTNNDVFTLRLDEPGAKAVKVSTSPGSDDGPQYSPDGKWLAFRSQARAGYESDRFRLMLYDRKTSALREVSLALTTYSSPPAIAKSGSAPIASPPVKAVTGDLDKWVDEFLWTSDSLRIFFASADHGQDVIYRTNVPEGNLHRFGRFTGARTAGEWSSLIQVGPGDRLAGVLMTVDKPGEVAIANMSEMDDSGFINMQVVSTSPSMMHEYNLRAGVPLATPNYLTHMNDGVLSGIELTRLEPYFFSVADGAKVEGFVVRPPNFDPSKKYPVKFLIHGGPQGAWGDAWSYRWNPELMAASGHVVVMVNPRGSTGYGQAFIDGVNGDWGGKAYVDLMKGLDAAEVQFPFIDKTRECALGASYGGFMANWILTHTNRFQCIVTHDGMYNPAAAYGDTEEMWFNEWEFRTPEDLKPGGKPAQPWRYASLPADQDPFRKWSPMLHIQDAKTPTLVIHSQRDYRLDVSEGLQLFTALQRLHVPSEMLYFPDEGHWVQKPKNSELWNKTVSDWCDKWTHTNAYANTGTAH
jgi:dipeptidyl aminopeptidase/acylaminoacyl peptidase